MGSKWKPYPEYKQSGLEWFPSIPTHWEIKRTDWFMYNDKIQVTPSDLGEFVFHYSIPSLSETGDGEIEDSAEIGSTKFLIEEETLLVSKLNPRKGMVLIARNRNLPTICSSEFVPLKAIDCDLSWAYFLFSSDLTRKRLSSVVQSATRSHQRARPDHITSMWHFVPPLEEQEQIGVKLVGIVDSISTSIANLENQLKLIEEKRLAIIAQAVTKGLNLQVKMKDSGIEWVGKIPTHWEIIPLKRDFSVQLGKMLQNEQKLASDTQEYYLKSANVQWYGVSLEPEVKMWFSEVEKSKYLLKKDDLLISEGGDVGRSCLYDDEYEECYIQNAINRVRATSTVPTTYLYFFMKAMHESGFVEIICNKSTIPHFTAEKVAEVRFTRPPVDEIKSIVEYLTRECNTIDEASSRLLNNIEKLKEYRTALISAAVTGQIDVRDYPLPEGTP